MTKRITLLPEEKLAIKNAIHSIKESDDFDNNVYVLQNLLSRSEIKKQIKEENV